MSNLEQATKQIRQAIRATKKDPRWFCENILNEEPDDWQIEILNALLDVERKVRSQKTTTNHKGLHKITIRAMHGPGKTYCEALAMHLFNFVYNGRIICTAPKEEQLKTRLWPEFRGIYNRAPSSYQSIIKIDATKITWGNDPDRVALAETAREPSSLAGHHREHMLFLVDEATGVKEEMFPVIEGALSTGVVVIVMMIGNPVKNTGTFYESHMRARVAKHWFKYHVSLDKTERVSPKWVAEMKEKYGEQSPVYQTRCLGNFADTAENQLVNLAWIIDAQNKEFYVDGSNPKLRVSIDVADGGIDETVITAAHQYSNFTHMLGQWAFSFPAAQSPIMAADEAERIFLKLGGRKSYDDLVVDGLGVGAGTAGALIKKGYRTIRYVGGGDSDNKKKWRNRRVQSYIVARDALRDGDVIIHPSFAEGDWDDFTAQMCSVLMKPGQDRVEDLLTKNEMKGKGIKSPDRADSYIMIYATQAPTLSSGEDLVGVAIESDFQRFYDGRIAI